VKQFILNIHRFRTGVHWEYILGIRSTLGIYSREPGVHWEYIPGSQEYIGNIFQEARSILGMYSRS